MAGGTRRKCKCCRMLFRPDPRNRHHQRYCSAAACRAASKAASQARWRAAPENQGYFRGPVNVARVQAWRSRHPGYWRRAQPRDFRCGGSCRRACASSHWNHSLCIISEATTNGSSSSALRWRVSTIDPASRALDQFHAERHVQHEAKHGTIKNTFPRLAVAIQYCNAGPAPTRHPAVVCRASRSASC